jgi:hypothetical protein
VVKIAEIDNYNIGPRGRVWFSWKDWRPPAIRIDLQMKKQTE